MARWLKGLLAGLLVGLVGAGLAVSPLYTDFERGIGLSWLFHMRGAVESPRDVVVIAIDGQTGAQLGLPDRPRNWPRTIHADLIDALVRLGATAIVFDMDFSLSRDTEHERVLAEAIERSGRVVLFVRLDGKRQPVVDTQGRHQGMIWVEEVVPPLPVLADATRGLGPFPLPKIEASVERFWVFKSSAREAPTMPAVALQVHALGEYAQWRQWLQDSGLEGIEVLPASADEIRTARDLRELMLNQRRLFEATVNGPGATEALQPPEAKVLRALHGLYAGPNHRFLNFYGPPGTVTNIPYQSIIQGSDPNLAPEVFDLEGKVAFVGASDLYDPGQPDRFYTVFTRDDGVDLSGVEIAATAFANLLTDRSLRTPDGISVLGGLLLFGLSVGALVFLLPAIVGVPLAILIVVVYVLGAQWAFGAHDTWMPLGTPVLVQFPLALFIGLISQYLFQRHRVQHISEAISRYVPENVSRDLANRSLDPDSVNKVVYSICLATDMAGFSTIAEKLSPGALAIFLNDYFDTLSKPLKRHQVSVTEFRADAIMCAWTADSAQIGIRRKAILASLEAADAVADFRKRHELLQGGLRIGLEAGNVYVGHAGGGGHFVYSIVGDCANTASRIEGLNKHLGTQVLGTDAVIEGIDGLLLRPLGGFVFVGKTEPLPVFEILAQVDNATVDQTRLCRLFESAMDAYRDGFWESARDALQNILEEFPDDGPSRFFLDRCQQVLDGKLTPDEPGVVRMQSK